MAQALFSTCVCVALACMCVYTAHSTYLYRSVWLWFTFCHFIHISRPCRGLRCYFNMWNTNIRTHSTHTCVATYINRNRDREWEIHAYTRICAHCVSFWTVVFDIAVVLVLALLLLPLTLLLYDPLLSLLKSTTRFNGMKSKLKIYQFPDYNVKV